MTAHMNPWSFFSIFQMHTLVLLSYGSYISLVYRSGRNRKVSICQSARWSWPRNHRAHRDRQFISFSCMFFCAAQSHRRKLTRTKEQERNHTLSTKTCSVSIARDEQRVPLVYVSLLVCVRFCSPSMFCQFFVDFLHSAKKLKNKRESELNIFLLNCAQIDKRIH